MVVCLAFGFVIGPHVQGEEELRIFTVQVYMAVSKNSGTPKSSILIGFSLINHPFWDTPNFGNTHIAYVL